MLNVLRLRAVSRPSFRSLACLCAVSLCVAAPAWPARGEEPVNAPEKVNWLNDYSKGVYESAACKRPMVIVVGAKWCGYCRKLYEQTLPNPGIISLLNEQFVPVMIDADKEQELTQKLKVESMPTVIVVSPERKILRRIAGFKSPAELNAQLTPFKKRLAPAVAAN